MLNSENSGFPPPAIDDESAAIEAAASDVARARESRRLSRADQVDSGSSTAAFVLALGGFITAN